jgi:hypothetical protein
MEINLDGKSLDGPETGHWTDMEMEFFVSKILVQKCEFLKHFI